MNRQWVIAAAAPAADTAGLHPLAWQLLYNRGLRTPDAIAAFLNPESQTNDFDPFRFRNMAAAIELVISHIKAGDKIVVCGDYDADGVTSSALLEYALRTLKGEAEVWIPSRFGEGYGLNKKIIEELKERDVKLIITVDNGIRAKTEVAYAKSIGIDVIVTDHHEGPAAADELPACLIINPVLAEETYPFKYLCGAGVAYKFADALISRSTLAEEDKQKFLTKLVDLAAIGTISDCVSLLGENRLLAVEGLAAINARPRLGLVELMKVAKIEEGNVSAWNISWQITPRLNVAGRLEHATAAYKLLATTDATEARTLAEDLNTKNVERQRITEEMVNAARAIIDREQANEKLLIVTAPDIETEKPVWSEGVIGLVAGRLCERYGKPCFVITKSEGKVKGSGRSIEQFDIGAILDFGKDQLERYGGHKAACGFTLKSLEHLGGFISNVRAAAEERLAGVDLTPVIRLDAELDIHLINDETVEAAELLKPYGQDNPEPKFASFKAIIEDIMTMGQDKKHIKFRLGGRWALAFGRAVEYKDYRIGQRIDVAYTLCFNIFNGRREAQLKIIDLRPADSNE